MEIMSYFVLIKSEVVLILNQVEAIGKVRHANIITLRAYYWSYDEKLLVYDYIPNGSLSSAIHGT